MGRDGRSEYEMGGMGGVSMRWEEEWGGGEKK